MSTGNPNAQLQVWPRTGHPETDTALSLAQKALQDHNQAFAVLKTQLDTLTARVAALESKTT